GIEYVGCRHAVDRRYVGQSYEIDVHVEPAWLSDGGLSSLRDAFHRAHERVFGHADPRAPVEMINLRVQLRGRRPRVPLVEVAAGAGAAPIRARRVWLDGHPMEARVFDRRHLGAGDRLVRPALIAPPDHAGL